MQTTHNRNVRLIAAAMAVLTSSSAQALNFDLGNFGGSDVTAQINTTLTFGASMRTEKQADDLVGKANNNPDLCGRENGNLRYQGCQGLFRIQTFTADRLVSGPGQANLNADDGNLNYDQYDITQAPAKLTVDMTLESGGWGLFVRGLYFHDFINNNFTEYHPNRITRDNYLQVATVSVSGRELLPATGLPVGAPITVANVRNDSIPCGNRDPDNNPATDCGLVFGKGGVVYSDRSEGETLRQIGRAFQMLDAVIFGEIPMPNERSMTVKLGKQVVNWGESTLLVFDAINQANPLEANNVFRVGSQVEEFFTPIGMLFASTNLADTLTLEGFYQLDWEPTVAPAPGSYYSFADLGSNDAGPEVLTLGFGPLPDDPDRVAFLIDNPLSGTTNTSIGFRRLSDREPDKQGQFGLALKYYAEWLNNGTELSLYYMNYHSRLPYVSLNSVPESCSKNSRTTVDFLNRDCPDVPLLHAAVDENNPAAATDSAIDFDKIELFLEYPEDIQMFGFSFNTTIGDFSLQGEVAYRPDAPLQVDLEDLAFAAYGPSGTNCHLRTQGCEGTEPPGVTTAQPGIGDGIGKMPDGSTSTNIPGSDFVVDGNGTLGAYRDTFDLTYGHAAGAGRYFPSFIIPYRGMTLGTNPGRSYIRGWEYFDTWQFNLGGTYLMGQTDMFSKAILADQIILLYEAGATWVPDLPDLDVLQIEAPGTFYHASAGADGSGADRSRQACSNNEACSFGPDGIRFNPHQEDLDLYPDKVSGGYALIFVISYESVLPAISLRPTIIWKHDVYGTAPGLAGNFVEGRMMADANLEIRYKSNIAFNIGYNVQAGGGKTNLLRDRDSARAFIKYQF